MKSIYTIIFSLVLLNCFSQIPVINSITGSSVICTGSSALNTYTVSASNSPIYYIWSVASPSAGVSIMNGSSSIASFSFPNSGGTFTILCSAVNNSGNSPEKEFEVNVFITPNVTFSGANTFCQGSSTNLSASSTIQGASQTVSYNWSPAFGLNTTTGSSVIANPSVSTNYTVTITNGSCSNTGQMTVTPFEQLSVTFSGANTFCQGSSTNLSASTTIQGASQTVSYNWSPGVGLNTTTGPNVIAFPYYPITYTVTSHYGNCSTNGQITVTPFEQLSVTFSGANTFCQGSSTNLSASTTIQGASQTVSYSWSPGDGLNTTTGPNVIASPTVATNYIVTATYGSCSTSGEIIVTPFEQLPIIFSGANTFCQGSSTNISASTTIQGGSQTVSYNWSPGVGLNTTTGPNVIANPFVATTYTVTSYYGSCSNSGQFTITPFEQMPISFIGDTSYCMGGFTNLYAYMDIQDIIQPITYSWSSGVGLNTTVGADVIASPTVSTTYTVTSYYGTCSSSGQITVAPNSLSVPLIIASANHSLVCFGDSVEVNAVGADTYIWSDNVTSGVPFAVYYTTTYYVTGTALNGCKNTASVTVAVNNIGDFNINSTNNGIMSPGQSATLTIIGTGTTYSLNGVPTNTRIVISPTVSTSYTFTSINSSGCVFTNTYYQYVGYLVNLQPVDKSSNDNYYLNIYPNPSDGNFNIKSSTKEIVKIINELGEIVRVIILDPEIEYQVSDLASGMYIIYSDRIKQKIIVTQ